VPGGSADGAIEVREGEVDGLFQGFGFRGGCGAGVDGDGAGHRGGWGGVDADFEGVRAIDEIEDDEIVVGGFAGDFFHPVAEGAELGGADFAGD